MPRIPGTTNRQSAFLRSFRLDPNPPPPSWPSRAILDRWLRRPAFRIAYDQVRESQRNARALFPFGVPTTQYRQPRHPRPRTVSGRSSAPSMSSIVGAESKTYD